MSLTTRQKKFLRGLTHQLQPVVIVGDKGLTENVMKEIEIALEHHELVKVRLRTECNKRADWAERIETECAAEMVHSIGQVACFFRRNPDKAVIELPG